MNDSKRLKLCGNCLHCRGFTRGFNLVCYCDKEDKRNYKSHVWPFSAHGINRAHTCMFYLSMGPIFAGDLELERDTCKSRQEARLQRMRMEEMEEI